MLSFIDYFKGSLSSHLKTTDDTIVLKFEQARRLNELAEGDHVYLTVRYLDRFEVVKFTKTYELKGGIVPVERDVLGKGRKNFPAGSCVSVDWNSVQLREFICQNKEC